MFTRRGYKTCELVPFCYWLYKYCAVKSRKLSIEVKNAIWRYPRPLANVQIPDGSVLCFCCIVQWGIKCNKLNFLSWDFTRKKTSTKLRMHKIYQQLAKQIYSTIVIVFCLLKAKRFPNSPIVWKCTTASCYLVQHSIFMTKNFPYIYTFSISYIHINNFCQAIRILTRKSS